MSSMVMLLSESLSHTCISGRVASGWLMAMMFYVSRPQGDGTAVSTRMQPQNAFWHP